MGITFYDRVQETSTTTGTGTLTLAGAVTGFQTFSSTVGNGNQTYYVITNVAGSWECGSGIYTSSGNTLSRTTVLSSSNSGSLVSFTGTLTVFQPSDPAAWINSVPTGSGTANSLTVWTGSETLSTSALTDDGTTIGLTGRAANFAANAASSFTTSSGAITVLPNGTLNLDSSISGINLGSTTASSIDIGNATSSTNITGQFIQGGGTFQLQAAGGGNVYAFGNRLALDSDTAVNVGTVFSPLCNVDSTTVNIGPSVATAINIGNASSATTTINIAGNAPTKNLNIGNNSLVAATSNGGQINVTGNNATNASGATAAGTSQTINIASGNGGNATTTSGGVSSAGGLVAITGGNGGHGATSVNAPGVGGAVAIAGGTGGAVSSGFSGALGGNITIDVGAGSGNAKAGTILIGNATNPGTAGTGSTGILIGYGTTAAGVNAANVGMGSWNAGNASGSTAAGSAGTLFLSAGNGGEASNTAGGTSSAGGTVAIASGTGGQGVVGNGAASGGNITITAGNAGAQLSTLNTISGGSITITAGNNGGVGTAGNISIQSGVNTGGTPSSINIGTTTASAGTITIGNTTQGVSINMVGVVFHETNCLSLASNFSQSNTTLTNTNFSWTLPAGTYNFDGVLSTENTTAADGIKFSWNNSFNVGSLFCCINVLSGTGTIGVGNTAAIATTLTVTAVATTPNYLGIHGMCVMSGVGNLILQAAGNAGTGAAKILAGSYINVWQNTPS